MKNNKNCFGFFTYNNTTSDNPLNNYAGCGFVGGHDYNYYIIIVISYNSESSNIAISISGSDWLINK